MVSYNYKEFVHLMESSIEKEKKYFFYGENIFQINLTVEQLLKKIGNAEKETVYSWESSLEQIFTKLSTSTLFYDKVVVILKNFELTKKKFRKSLVEFIKNYECKQYLIIIHEGVLPYKEMKNDKDGILDFLLKNTVSVDFPNFSKEEILNNFIPNNCTKKLSDSAKQLLFENSGNDMYLLYNELNKISFYKPDIQEITETDVEKCCSVYDNTEMKDLFYNIENRNMAKSLSILSSLVVNGIEPVYLSVSLHRYFRKQFLWGKIQQSKIFDVLKELYNMDYKLKTTSNSKYVLESGV
ncbi:MAG: DNA polymerase III subunit delta, partial [Endomicrobiia bacterium]